MMRVTIILSLLSALVAASPVPDIPHVVHEKRFAYPARWRKSGNLVDGDQVLQMRIGLSMFTLLLGHIVRAEPYHVCLSLFGPQGKVTQDVLNNRNTVSDPRSPQYGQHYSPQDIAHMFAPSRESTIAVHNWLTEFGIPEDRISLSSNRGWLHFDISVAEAEELLRTEYHHFGSATGQSRLAVDEYSVPAHVQPHIDLIFPTLHFDDRSSRPIVVNIDEQDQVESLQKRSLHPHIHWGGAVPNQGISSTASDATVIGSASATESGAPVPTKTPINPANISVDTTDDCATYVTPFCLRTLYDFFPNDTTINSNSSLAITEFGNLSTIVEDDVTSFMNKFVPNATNFLPTLYEIDGAVINQTNVPSINNTANFALHGEAALDVQYALALAYPQPITYYQVGNDSNLDFMNQFLDAVDASYCTFEGGDDTKNNSGIIFDNPDFNKTQCGAFPASQIVSTSYGSDEIDMTAAYEQRQCMEFGKLGMMGITFLFSSGDAGVASNYGCLNPDYSSEFNASALIDGTQYTNGSYGNFVPGSPVGCPYVTVVGATQIAPGNTVNDREVTAHVNLPQRDGSVYVYSSGGGFSNVFEMPSYQSDAVGSWFSSHSASSDNPESGRYNSTGNARGYPDIAANGANYTILLGGQYSYVFGTSASCPVAAAILSSINNARLNAGMSSLGFINPVLYQNPSALNDIVSGENPGCGTNGFQAAEGWDPNTGLGTINYPKLLDVFLNAGTNGTSSSSSTASSSASASGVASTSSA